MPDTVTGAAQYALLARALRYSGQDGLRRDMNKRIAAATGPVMRAQRGGLPEHLPVRYAADVSASLSLRTVKNVTAGISIKGTTTIRNRRIRRLDAGWFTHPLFGDRKHWYVQLAKRPGWFSQPAEDSAPAMREAIEAAMEDTARAILDAVRLGG